MSLLQFAVILVNHDADDSVHHCSVYITWCTITFQILNQMRKATYGVIFFAF